jgi:hypothetical protein
MSNLPESSNSTSISSPDGGEPSETGAGQGGVPDVVGNPEGAAVEIDKSIVFRWGGIGGLLYAAADMGLLNFNGVAKIFSESEDIGIQITTLLAFGVVMVLVGGIWARIHTPIHTIAVAVQLGLIAPIAVNTLIVSAASSYEDSDETSSSWSLPGLFISVAHAEAANEPEILYQQKPGLVNCIVLTLIKKPC